MLAILGTLATQYFRGRRLGYRGIHAFPKPYHLALIGVPIFLIAAPSDAPPKGLREQRPIAFALATWLGSIPFGTA